MSRESPKNLNFILKQLERGTPSTQILSQVEGRRNRFIWECKDEQRGILSERIARNAISKLPFVKYAIITPSRSPEDLSLVDIRVRLNGIPNVARVSVQVKSSEKGIEHAKLELRRGMGLNEEELSQWLITSRLIFVNGQTTHVEIQRQFMDQLDKIVRTGDNPQSNRIGIPKQT